MTMINGKWSRIMSNNMQLSINLGRTSSIKSIVFCWAIWDRAQRHLFALACISSSASNVPPAVFFLAPSHLSKKKSTSASFWQCLQESVAIGRGNDWKGWKVNYWTAVLNNKKSQGVTAFPHSAPSFCFHHVVSASATWLNKNNSSGNKQDLPTQKNKE